MLIPFRTSLHEVEGRELLEERPDVTNGNGRFDCETLGHASRYGVAVRLPVQGGPDEGSRGIQCVNSPTGPVEHHSFTLDVSYREVGSWLEVHTGS
jgi:hypothetical protein